MSLAVVMGTRTIYLGRLPGGAPGTLLTLRMMGRLARIGARDPRIVELARSIATKGGGGLADQLRALFAWVRDHIRYERDPGFELLSEPASTVARGREDCDGKATLLASLIFALGLPVRVGFRAISTTPGAPDRFSHVYVVTSGGSGGVLALDATYPGTPFGAEYPRASGRKDLWL